MEKCMNWWPKDFCRLIGTVVSGSRASLVPIRISRDSIDFVRDEMLGIIDDVTEAKRYLGIFKSSVKKDLALDASTLPSSFEPEKTHMYSAPMMMSYLEIIGEITCRGIEQNLSIPRPGSYVYAVIDGEALRSILKIENGLLVGVHKFSSMVIHLNPSSLRYHIAVLGATGTGKSRLVKGIIEEIIKVTNYSVIVFDHTGIDYVDKSRWSINYIEVVDVSKVILDPDVVAQILLEDLGISEYHGDYIYGSIVEYIRRVVEKQNKVTIQENSRGQNYISSHTSRYDLETLISIYKHLSREGRFTWSFSEYLESLYSYIRSMGGKEYTIEKIRLLLTTRVGKKFFETYLNNRTIDVEEIVSRLFSSRKKVVIVDLSSEMEYIAKKNIVYQFMKYIWDRIVSDKLHRDNEIIAVIDEAHNYCCTYGCEPAKGMIARVAREGRKWGFGLILSSQRVIDLAPEIRGNINTVFFSRLQSSGDYAELKNWLENVQYIEYTLPTLASREFFFTGLGNPLRRPILVRVKDVS
ncbi:MAG: ATP-binding protein [Ignisphaera sp.]